MFRLHQSVRRRLCQAGFCLFCLLPTAAMFGWSISRKLPGHIRRYESKLAEQLGLSVRLTGISYPRPDTSLLEGLVLSDAETGEAVFQCRLLEATRTDDALVMTISEGVFDADRMNRLWALLDRRLRRELPSRENLLLLPCRLTMAMADGEQTYEVLEGRIEADASGEAAEVRFRLAGVEMSEPATIRVIRNQQHRPPSTRISLATGKAALPCSLFAPLLDLEATLGSRATFSGTLWADDANQLWEAEVAGRLEQIDLRSLVSQRFPHMLDGSAALEIKGARFESSRLIEAYGRFDAGPGVIGQSLVQSAIQAMGAVAEQQDAVHGPKAYEQLAFNFGVSREGLAVAGACQSDTADALLVERGGTTLLVKSADQAPRTAIDLLRLLVPASEVLVPATAETAALIPWLPVPAIVPPSQSNGAAASPAVAPRIRGVR